MASWSTRRVIDRGLKEAANSPAVATAVRQSAEEEREKLKAMMDERFAILEAKLAQAATAANSAAEAQFSGQLHAVDKTSDASAEAKSQATKSAPPASTSASALCWPAYPSDPWQWQQWFDYSRQTAVALATRVHQLNLDQEIDAACVLATGLAFGALLVGL